MDQAPPSPPSTPNALADALGDIRAEIRALKAREAGLRQAILDARPNAPVSGTRYEVSIREGRRRVLDRDRLPDFVLNDERFWKISQSRTVVTRACAPAHTAARESGLPPAGDRVGDRIREPTLDLWGDAEPELVLIEEF